MLLTEKKYYYTWICSYLIIIILSIFISQYGCSVAVRVIEEETAKINLGAVERIKNACDSYFHDLNSISSRLLQSYSVERLVAAPILTPKEKTEWASDMVKNVALSTSSNEFIKDCLIVINEKNLCITATGTMDVQSAYDVGFKEYYPAKDAFISDLYNTEMKQYKLMTNSRGERKLFYMHVLPSILKPKSVAVIVEVDTDKLNMFLQNARDRDGSIYLANSASDEIIVGEAKHNYNIQLLKESDSFLERVNGEKLNICYVKSDTADFYYVSMVSGKQYLEKINLVKVSFVLSYFVCLVLCGGLAYVFSNISYKDRKCIEKKFDEQKKNLRANKLSKILSGEIPLSGEIMRSVTDNELSLTGQSFVVVAFNISSIGVLSSQREEAKSEDYQMACFAVSNVFSTLVEEIATASYCQIGHLYVSVLSCFEVLEDEGEVVQQAEYLSQYLKQNLGIEFICAISPITTDITKLPDLYDNAIEVIDFRFLGSDKSVFVYDDIVFDATHYEYKVESDLINSILVGDENKALSLIDEELSCHRDEPKMSIGVIRNLITQIIGTIFKVAVKIDRTQQLDYRKLCIITTNFTNENQIEDAKKVIDDFIGRLCQISIDNNVKSKSLRIQAIKEFIHHNYDNLDLNVGLVADEFDLTFNYMSRLFKEQTGEGMADYITRYRIEKAKEFLSKTDRNVTEISLAVGFSSVAVFIRAFKKYEKVTPNQFKAYCARSLFHDENEMREEEATSSNPTK